MNYTLANYLDKEALRQVIDVDNKANIFDLRQNIPFNFLNFLNWDVRPNANTAVTKADNSALAARVTNFDVASDTHTRGSLEEIILSKYPIHAQRVKNEKECLELSNFLQTSQTPTSIIVQNMFADVIKTKQSIYERMEYMFLQALSNLGKIVLDGTSNNGGVTTTIDFGLSTANQFDGAVDWVTSATATPITDIKTVLADANGRGYFPTTIFMTQTQFNNMIATKEFTDFATKTITATAQSGLIGVGQVNTVFSAVGLPTIQIITDAVFGYNNLGVKTRLNSWNTDYVVLGFNGNMGTMAVATPPTDLFAGAASTIFAVDNTEGIVTTLETKYNPVNIITQSRVFAMPNMPAIYDFMYLKVANI